MRCKPKALFSLHFRHIDAQKNDRHARCRPFFGQTCELGLSGSANGAGASASAALDALVSIDHVLAVAFSDSVHGALSLASAAADAFVIDNVSHRCTSNKIPDVCVSAVT
jgi:hypothetical protein